MEQIKEILSWGDPSNWEKNGINKERVQMMERIFREVFNNRDDICGWCTRREMYKHLLKYAKGHGIV